MTHASLSEVVYSSVTSGISITDTTEGWLREAPHPHLWPLATILTILIISISQGSDVAEHNPAMIANPSGWRSRPSLELRNAADVGIGQAAIVGCPTIQS